MFCVAKIPAFEWFDYWIVKIYLGVVRIVLVMSSLQVKCDTCDSKNA